MVYACHYQGDDVLVACKVEHIQALVAMIPYFKVLRRTQEIEVSPTEHFLVEKPYLQLTYFRQAEDEDSSDEDEENQTDQI